MYEELVQRWSYMLLRNFEGSAKDQEFGLPVWGPSTQGASLKPLWAELSDFGSSGLEAETQGRGGIRSTVVEVSAAR